MCKTLALRKEGFLLVILNLAMQYEIEKKQIRLKQGGGEVTGFRFDSLSSDLQQQYLRYGVEVAADAFHVPSITPEFEREVLEHLLPYETFFLIKNSEPVGFMSSEHFTYRGKGVVYIAGLVVKQSVQANGVGQALAREGKTLYKSLDLPIDYIAGRTQNPVVARARGRYCENLFPIRDIPTEEVIGISHELRERLGMSGEFNEQTLVNKDTYTHPLFRTLSGEQDIDEFFAAHVGCLDSMFIMGRPNF